MLWVAILDLKWSQLIIFFTLSGNIFGAATGEKISINLNKKREDHIKSFLFYFLANMLWVVMLDLKWSQLFILYPFREYSGEPTEEKISIIGWGIGNC